jgi:hypothetical protein
MGCELMDGYQTLGERRREGFATLATDESRRDGERGVGWLEIEVSDYPTEILQRVAVASEASDHALAFLCGSSNDGSRGGHGRRW